MNAPGNIPPFASDRHHPGDDRLPPGTFPSGYEIAPLPGGTGTFRSKEVPRAAPPVTGQPAGFLRRAAAFLIDLLLVEFLAAVLGTVSAMGQQLSEGRLNPLEWGMAQDGAVLVAGQLMPALLFGYFFFFSGYGGRTVGKMLMGIRVIRADGSELTWASALARTLCYLASVLTWGLGFLLAAGPAKRALHDRLAGTRVVRVAATSPSEG